MSAIGLRPRSSTELVDAAIQVYKRAPLSFILAVALIYVPWLIVRVVGGVGVEIPAAPTPAQLAIASVGGVLVYMLAAGVTTVIASDVYLDRPVDIARSFRTVAGQLAPLIITTIVVSLMIGFAALFILLPALYPISRFFAVRQVLLLEGGGMGNALSRSTQLSMGHKRHVLNTLLLVFLVTFAISIGLTLLVPAGIFQAVLGTLLSTILYPAFGITETLLYYDLRIRKEGFDVEYLASQTSPSGEAASVSASR